MFPKPAVCKPNKLWTGRQLLALVFHKTPFDYNDTSKLFTTSSDADLIVHRGNILSGQIKKAHFGEGGQLISSLTTNYGSKATSVVINYFQAIVTPWVHRYGASVGIRDCIMSSAAEAKIESIVSTLPARLYDPLFKASESTIFKMCSEIRSDIAKVVMVDAATRKNRIREMVMSGSKGSEVNLVQIQGCLGQQFVGGSRPFQEDARRVFPQDPFANNEKNVESRGYVGSSFVQGLTPREYFCHAAGGREGIIDTGIKTSKTGYSTRRMACVTEGAVVSFTGAVFNQSILQGVLTSILYGADGMDASKLVRHYLTLHQTPVEDIEQHWLTPSIPQGSYRTKMVQQLVKDREMLLQICSQRQKMDTMFWLPVDVMHIIGTNAKTFPHISNPADRVTHDMLWRAFFQYDPSRYVVYKKNHTKHGREINEYATRLFRCMLRLTFLKEHHRLTKTEFALCLENILDMFNRSQVEAGEPVGLIATQSLMQATMQATLNTFHMAGTNASAAATGGLNYFDALISVQTPKITTTTIVLCDPSKEFMVMEAVAPPVKLCDIVSRVYDPSVPNTENNNPWSIHSFHPPQYTRVIEFVIPDDKIRKKCVRRMQVYTCIASHIGENHVELLPNGNVLVYIPNNLYNRALVEELLALYVKNPRLTPRGKDKSHRGVVGARRVKAERLVRRGDNLVNEQFTQIEVYGNFRLADIFSIEGVDCARSSCNDVSEIQATLGSNAARRFMFKELHRTVTGSGSAVNPRFVMQVVDYMLWTGKVESITRHGMKLFGPMKSAAFEQPGKVLVNAALACKTEHMLSPTANVVFGQEIRGIGTAIVDTIPITLPPLKSTNLLTMNAGTDSNETNDDDDTNFIIPFMKFMDLTAPNGGSTFSNKWMDTELFTTTTTTVQEEDDSDCVNPFMQFT